MATKTLLWNPRWATGAKDSCLSIVSCRHQKNQFCLLNVSLLIFMYYYLFNRICISQRKVLGISLNNTKVSLSSISINMDNWFFVLLEAPTHSHPVQEVLSNKGKYFNVVIAVFKSAELNTRPQGHPSEAPDERQAPGTAAYRERIVNNKRISCWM